MIGGKLQRRKVCTQQAGVGDELNASFFCRGDRVLMLANPLAGLCGRDQQQLLHAAESTFQARGIVVVASANGNSFSLEAFRFGRISDNGCNLLRWDSLQQGMDDKPAELASGTGHCNHGTGLSKTAMLFMS